MIKLNNKNITYVALADTNNSIKAPKEIWYADSNNSVKLVYRRKDALIEGEDYEKYHWLQGRNGAYINTKYGLTPFDDAFYVKAKYDGSIKNPDNDEQYVFGMRNYVSSTNRYYCVTLINALNKIAPRYCNLGSDNPATDEATNFEVFLSADTDYMYRTLNGVAYPAYLHDGTFVLKSDKEIYLFKANFTDSPQEAVNKYFHGDISSFRITDHTFTTDKLHLIPCKLLKPVPKWLDANGIRRQVGECGMIDLISGKFYGNVNSVGTFTVENYYERKEWLKGDGSAYIDTDIIVDVPSLKYSLELIHDTNNVEFICGSRNSTHHDSYSSAIAIDNIHNDTIRLDVISDTSSPSPSFVYGNIISNEPNEVHINCQTNSAIVNNSSIAGNRTVFSNSVNTFRIFDFYPKDTSRYPNTCTCKISYFTLNDSTHSINLIPCTLTMDLPASMDANGIARTKGTSGMWDLVSDRFYGNVANSGTFKAVNLAEGVDYEVHDWLVGDGSAYIDTLIYDLTGKSIYCKLERNAEITDWTTTRILGREGDSRFVVTYANTSYTTNITLWTQNRSYAPRFTTTEGWIRINFEDNLVETHQSSESIETYTIKSSNLSIILFGDRLSTTTVSRIYKGKIGQLTVNQAMNLIPVKLLKAISSKYDANGIARQAGECGMYDTVNDVFYGNVASNGTFSVSDDN